MSVPRVFILYLTLMIVCLIPLPLQAAARLPLVNIGVVRDGPEWRQAPYLDLIKQEIQALTAGEFDVRFPDSTSLQGNWDPEKIQVAIDTLMNRPDVDMVLALGVVSSSEISRLKTFPKPVFAPIILDAELQGLPMHQGTSGVKNFNYIDLFVRLERNVAAFWEMAPFKHLVVIVDELLLRKEMNLADRSRREVDMPGIAVSVVGVGGSAVDALNKLPPTADAVFIAPVMRFDENAFQTLVAGLIERRLPSFSLVGREDVEAGILAGITPKSDFNRVARRLALNIQSVLLGEDAGSLNVHFSMGERLTLNMATARAIGFSPTWRVLADAELLHPETPDSGPILTLDQAVQDAIQRNPDLSASRHRLAAGAESVKESRSALLPRIECATQATLIDEDRAEAGAGQQPERTWAGGINGSQVIYSEEAWANHVVQQHVQVSRAEELAELRLDIVAETATAYLDILRAQVAFDIQKNNLALTRANIDRARVRQSAGMAGPMEVYRWESEVANSRKAVIAGRAAVEKARDALSRLLANPQGNVLHLAEPREDVFRLFPEGKSEEQLITNPRDFNRFVRFMVAEAHNASPELRRLDALIAAQTRTLVATRRNRWLPTFSLQGNLSERIDTGGSGISAGVSPLPGKDDTDWSVALSATLPLYEGGAKGARVRRALEELHQLRFDRQAAKDRIEQRVRTALYAVSASHPAIALSRDAAEAAKKNFMLVTDAYARGALSIIDLLDAQNAFLVADLAAMNARYDFLIDVVAVERAVGWFPMLSGEMERAALYQRLKVFFDRSNGPGR